MDKFVVIVFPTEAKAYEGTRVMKDLQADGSLTVYGMAVVTKATDGKLSVDDKEAGGPGGTVAGALAGGLVGLIGGPVGAAAGVAGGAMIGTLFDIFGLGVGEDFLFKVTAQLTPGKSAVVAEVDEEWITPLDSKMEGLGGTVLRQARADFEEEQIKRGISETKADLAALEAEYRQAREQDKVRLKVRIEASRTELQARAARAREKREELRRDADAKIAALREQHAKARADVKARLELRIADFGEEYARRADELERVMRQVEPEVPVF